MNKPTFLPEQNNALFAELKRFLDEFNELHDSSVKEIKWMPHRQILKLYVHDIMNQYFEAERYAGKKTGVLIFEKIQKISLGIGIADPFLCVVGVQIEKLPDSCRLKIKLAPNNSIIDVSFQAARFPSIEQYQPSEKHNEKDA